MRRPRASLEHGLPPRLRGGGSGSAAPSRSLTTIELAKSSAEPLERGLELVARLRPGQAQGGEDVEIDGGVGYGSAVERIQERFGFPIPRGVARRGRSPTRVRAASTQLSRSSCRGMLRSMQTGVLRASTHRPPVHLHATFG